MIKSMTGYGKGQAATDGMVLTVEVKSVNHRYGDVSVKCPRHLLAFENDIKKRVSARVNRGKTDVFINQESTAGGASVPAVNKPLAAAYVQLFEQMSEEYPVEGGIPLSLLLSQRDVIVVRDVEVPEEELQSCLEQALEQALSALDGMRCREGEATGVDMTQRLAGVESLLAEIEGRAPEIPLQWKQKLTERLERLGGEFEADPQRVAQELAIFADRCDITEEIVRFRSHLAQFRGLMQGAEPVGRQLDFLVQELNRETNTMGSKSNDADLTRLVVAVKAELEKIREQVQNVE